MLKSELAFLVGSADLAILFKIEPACLLEAVLEAEPNLERVGVHWLLEDPSLDLDLTDTKPESVEHTLE